MSLQLQQRNPPGITRRQALHLNNVVMLLCCHECCAKLLIKLSLQGPWVSDCLESSLLFSDHPTKLLRAARPGPVLQFTMVGIKAARQAMESLRPIMEQHGNALVQRMQYVELALACFTLVSAATPLLLLLQGHGELPTTTYVLLLAQACHLKLNVILLLAIAAMVIASLHRCSCGESTGLFSRFLLARYSTCLRKSPCKL